MSCCLHTELLALMSWGLVRVCLCFTQDCHFPNKENSILPHLASPAISATSGSWYLWPAGRKTPFVCPRRLWSRHVHAGPQIEMWRWVVLLVCTHPKTNRPCWWRAPDEWVPRGHTAIYFASIMSQCGRSQSFRLLRARTPPHWRIRPLLGQKNKWGQKPQFTQTQPVTPTVHNSLPHTESRCRRLGGCWFLQKLLPSVPKGTKKDVHK